MREIEKERQMIQSIAQKSVQKIVAPKAAEIDTRGLIPQEIVESFGRQGLLSILLPEEYGGTEGDVTSFCLVIEEVAKTSGACSLLILAQGVGSLPLILKGSVSQKERYFRAISEKNTLAAFSLNESRLGYDGETIRTRAERKGDSYVLNGSKAFITHGGVPGLFCVIALTHPSEGVKETSAFLVEGDSPGLTLVRREEKVGMRGTFTADLILENCEIPAANLLGQEGGGWSIVLNTLTVAKTAVGAQAVGIAQGALDYASHYAQERVQFGKPIASFQAIQFMIADMATQVEAARALVYEAAARIDDGAGATERFSAMAKLYASESAIRVTTDAVQILGGYGYMRDYPVERMMRDAKVTQVFEGPNPVHRWLLAQDLLRG